MASNSSSASFSLVNVTQHRLKSHASSQQVIFEGLPRDRWYTLVLDPYATGVLSSHLQMNELLDYNVTVVEDLTKKRKEGKHAIYIVAPLWSSLSCIMEDYTCPKPVYEHAYVFLTSKLPDKLLNVLKGCAPLINRLKALKEVHSEFWSIDSHSFHTGQPNALPALFGEDIKQSSWDAETLKAAHRLSTVFTTLKSQPSQIYIRTPAELPEMALNAYRKKVCQTIGERVRDNLNSWKMKDPTLFTGAQCDLIVIDRGTDPVAPVMHPFHYASAIHDLVPLEDNFVYKYSERAGRGAENVVDVLLNEQDPLYCEWRHRHIGEVGTLIPEKLQEIKKSKTAQLEGGGKDNMGKAVQGLPEYLAMKRKLEVSTAIVDDIFKQQDKRDLREVGKLEQGLVFGELKSRDIITAMQSVLQNWNSNKTEGVPTSADKMRLLLSYIATDPGKLDHNNRSQWQSVARISANEMHTVCNIRYLGVETNKTKSSSMGFGLKRSGKAAKYKSSGADSLLENDRFRPMLMELIDSFVARRLASMPNFSVVKAGNDFAAALAPESDGAPGAGSVRSTGTRVKPTWQRNTNKASGVSADGIAVGQRIVVVFIVGGYTWSEVQAAHELSQQHNIQVILGGTNIIHSGEAFLRDLAALSPLSSGNVEVDMRA